METVKDLFDFIMRNPLTSVFGNLGRYPKVIHDALISMPYNIEVTVISRHYPFPTTDHRIKVVHPADPIHRCDLLIYMEPDSLQVIKKQPQVSHVVVFASHFTFHTYSNDYWNTVSYFHTTNTEDLVRRTQTLLSRQDASLQSRDVGMIGIDYTNVLITRGETDKEAPKHPSYVIVDLTKYDKDTLSMYLAFWDAFDYMLDHLNLVHRWVICFSESNGHRAFDRFIQKCIDSLFCRNIEHGNVTDIKHILSLLPYYKSGIVDRTFHVPVSSFGGVGIIAPKNLLDLCKAATVHDLDHIAKNIYRVRGMITHKNKDV
jgi:hypothetical protein